MLGVVSETLECQSLSPSNTLSPARPHLLNLLKQSDNWGPSAQTPELLGTRLLERRAAEEA